MQLPNEKGETLCPPRQSRGSTPVRAGHSFRRTSSIEVTWSEDIQGPMHFVGRARDIFTSRVDCPPTVLQEDHCDAVVRSNGSIISLCAEPARPDLDRLTGARIGGGFRRLLEETDPDERAAGSPLSLLLDDMTGVILVAGAAWTSWDPEWVSKMMGDVPIESLLKARENACIAHVPGSSAQNRGKTLDDPGESIAADLPRADDPRGWHELQDQEGVGFRRARRIDIAFGEVILIDAEFQDSGTRPDGRRNAIHEYGLRVTADRDSHEVLSATAEPRVLPYRECPSAQISLKQLLGTPLPALRERVRTELAGPAGCTHLNDALRALADVPALMCNLPSIS